MANDSRATPITITILFSSMTYFLGGEGRGGVQNEFLVHLKIRDLVVTVT